MVNQYIQSRNPRFKISFPQTNGKSIYLPIYNIPYIKAYDQVSIIMFDDGEKLNETLTTDSIGALTETLKQYYFIRTHRSYLVNVSYIKGVNTAARKIILACDTKIPIPQTKIKDLKKLLDEMS